MFSMEVLFCSTHTVVLLLRILIVVTWRRGKQTSTDNTCSLGATCSYRTHGLLKNAQRQSSPTYPNFVSVHNYVNPAVVVTYS
ncbi:hypothetical protein HOLleu_21777 [Holothuria leucospilota]|uniref:Uncharacterized protein n=1 Tax=Holothuria leucospilota TaxID=206669 RepID=A0A9Q1BYC7_HOLLE|nr:hypothetical protein HOLleu_21777 [Holothuria leucospilota]